MDIITTHDLKLLKQLRLQLKTESINDSTQINKGFLMLSAPILDYLQLTTIAQYQNQLLAWQNEVIQRQMVGTEELVDELDLIREMQTIKLQFKLLNFNTPMGGQYLMELDYDVDQQDRYYNDPYLNQYISQICDIYDVKEVNRNDLAIRMQNLIDLNK